VAITRARHKLVIVGSAAFFSEVAYTDTGLRPIIVCFKAYYHLCKKHGALFDVRCNVFIPDAGA
jgi:uncharacterized protein (DUF488 family)